MSAGLIDGGYRVIRQAISVFAVSTLALLLSATTANAETDPCESYIHNANVAHDEASRVARQTGHTLHDINTWAASLIDLSDAYSKCGMNAIHDHEMGTQWYAEYEEAYWDEQAGEAEEQFLSANASNEYSHALEEIGWAINDAPNSKDKNASAELKASIQRDYDRSMARSHSH
jgi:hypothetical protein